MTWGYVAVAGASLIGGSMAAKGSKDAAKTSAQASAGAAAGNEALLREGYESAQRTLSPYLASSAAANRQLMAELGLSPQYETTQRQTRASNLASLEQELVGLQKAQADQAQTVQSMQKKRKGLKGFKNKYFGIRSTKRLFGGKESALPNEDYQSQIDDVERQIAEEKNAIEQFSQAEAQPTAAYKPGTAYMQTPAYQAAMQSGIEAVNQGAAGAGGLYSGARGTALRDVGQGVQQQYYNNYMNMLQNLANPATATNLSNIGIGTAGNIGSSNIASINQANTYRLMGQEAQNAATADIIGGLTSAYTSYLNRPQEIKQAPQTAYTGDMNINPYVRTTA